MEQRGFNFTDQETGDQGYCSVRVLTNGIALATSLSSNGDLEVFLSRKDAQTLTGLLQEALGEFTSG